MAVKAICVRCGQVKDCTWDPCSACGLDPSQSDEATMVRSVYLSLSRFDDEKEAEQRAWEQELGNLSEQIQRGESIHFDQEELDRLLDQKRLLESVSGRSLIVYLLRVFWPGLVVLGLWLLWWLSQRGR